MSHLPPVFESSSPLFEGYHQIEMGWWFHSTYAIKIGESLFLFCSREFSFFFFANDRLLPHYLCEGVSEIFICTFCNFSDSHRFQQSQGSKEKPSNCCFFTAKNLGVFFNNFSKKNCDKTKTHNQAWFFFKYYVTSILFFFNMAFKRKNQPFCKRFIKIYTYVNFVWRNISFLSALTQDKYSIITKYCWWNISSKTFWM